MTALRHAPPAVGTAPVLGLDEASIRRLVVALVAAELERLRRRALSPAEVLAWRDETRLDEAGLGFDSLALLDLCSLVDQYFHLHESGIEDYLFVRRSLGEWVTIVAEGLRRCADRFSFRTSGSTGQPKVCTHAARSLAAEIAVLGDLLGGTRRIVSLVPPHHIYGFLFTVGLPLRLGVPVLEARALSPAALRRQLAPGDLVIATPFLWSHLQRGIAGFPPGVRGVSSTAPMPPALAEALRACGLEALCEIYGSSETAGVGWRWSPQAPFRLFPYWSLAADGASLLRSLPGSAPESLALCDHLERADEADTFRPAGRRDMAIQIGGSNVFPQRIAAFIEGIEGVRACAVRPEGDPAADPLVRLKAFVVPAGGEAPDRLEQAIRAAVAGALPAPAQPVRYAFGDALPVSAMGKQADW